MEPGKYYYRLCEAEKLKQTYSSWINKRAHVGDGEYAVLKGIIIKPKRTVKTRVSTENLFIVKFEFLNTKRIDAWLFLKNNGLSHSNEPEINHSVINGSTNP